MTYGRTKVGARDAYAVNFKSWHSSLQSQSLLNLKT